MPQPFDRLLEQFLADELDSLDVQSFLDEAPQQEALIGEKFSKGLDIYNGESEGFDKEALFQDVLERSKQLRPAPVKTIYKRWLVAASVVLLIGVGAYFAFFGTDREQSVIAQAGDVQAPVASKARIVLSDGRTVAIDSLNTITDGSVTVTKDAKGNIIYAGNEEESRFNTLVNPRGSQVATTTLIDGTKVWLNAESSIRYFTSNAGVERKVEITGEAYFEVAKDKNRPFVVSKGNTNITVLGTHFNVNAYDDEESLRVTLLEGSVKVLASGADHAQFLKSGQQMEIINNQLSIINNPDMEQVMAWKNGLFAFNKAGLQTVMRQLAKWYNVEVEYRGQIPPLTFGGEIERTLSLSQILKVLEKSEVHFKIENLPGGNQKIIVTP
jgi:transmembrane sensor